MTLLNSLLEKKLVLVTGKGGIGKSLTAASIAQYAASQGKKVCLVESNAQEQLAPLFGQERVGHKLQELSPNLFAINLNPQDNFRDFVVLHLGFAKLFEKVFTKPLVKSFINMLPGISELTLLGRLYYFSQLDDKHNFDMVVLDGFASGHFMSLLKTPDAVLDSGMVGPVIKETKMVKDFIFDERYVSVVLVTMPENLIVSEAIDFSERFKTEIPVPHSHVIVNRCLLLDESEEQALKSASSMELAVRYMKARLESESSSLQRLKQGLHNIYQGLQKEPQLLLLPDLGAVDEPLSGQFARSWFDQAEGVSF
ncbi:ArsA family ATPase [Pseudobacteriovorax antillogorgiicola]|uniref:arsenite-transporting ATPase n=1 Tax=Pseudobacteriovorax antillogorgiicola TaxID=1513793 RepID=A0A1Y6BR67_9BACT|nr:ArsA-related P-loop ATPase [Pseudobacteriovorax antillogorgiicola]TCS53872.1 anion-transporting ArsA/GET3 family ATPase [Pseudobacteriovorax antillogorgiicola]SMF21274.1 Anion-transporting ATPase, ArsA/GET3 family [Pseudobacteriovorax antillogorgiicola]